MSPGSDVRDRTFIVTGAASGLGRATAVRLCAAGAKVVLTDRDGAGLDRTLAMIEARDNTRTIVGDVTLEETARSCVEIAGSAFGALHGLCNVAGTLGAGGGVEDCSIEEFDRVMNVNCRAQMTFIRHAVPALRRAGKGAIVNVASVGALVALPHMAAYCASKAAVLGLTRAAALELAPSIRCNAVCPGGIDSPMAENFLAQFENREEMVGKLVGRQMLRRFAQPEEIAEVLLFLLSDASSFVTGAVWPVEAGHTAW
jgi:NAD(P)-dependent dehydrogenase (short-subunit alcohol dehydrogenase family)